MRYHPLPDWVPEGNFRKHPIKARWGDVSHWDVYILETRCWSDGWVAFISTFSPNRWYGFSWQDGWAVWADSLEKV